MSTTQPNCWRQQLWAIILLTALPTSAKESPLRRQYRHSEALTYRISGTHAKQGVISSSYSALGSVTVKKSSDNTFYEEIGWAGVRKDDHDIILPPASREFRQRLSLDLDAQRPAIPPLAKLDSSIYGPMLDLLTFYADLLLAIKYDALQKAGDHVFVPHGIPNSWADGRRKTFAQDCIDFNISLVALNSSSATLKVSHVPPRANCGKVPAPWMLRPVSDTTNNWFQVEMKSDNIYDVGVGQEFFDAEIQLSLPSATIESAILYNPIHFEERTCKDAALTDCGPSAKGEILRRINLIRLSPEKS